MNENEFKNNANKKEDSILVLKNKLEQIKNSIQEVKLFLQQVFIDSSVESTAQSLTLKLKDFNSKITLLEDLSIDLQNIQFAYLDSINQEDIDTINEIESVESEISKAKQELHFEENKLKKILNSIILIEECYENTKINFDQYKLIIEKYNCNDKKVGINLNEEDYKQIEELIKCGIDRLKHNLQEFENKLNRFKQELTLDKDMQTSTAMRNFSFTITNSLSEKLENFKLDLQILNEITNLSREVSSRVNIETVDNVVDTKRSFLDSTPEIRTSESQVGHSIDDNYEREIIIKDECKDNNQVTELSIKSKKTENEKIRELSLTHSSESDSERTDQTIRTNYRKIKINEKITNRLLNFNKSTCISFDNKTSKNQITQTNIVADDNHDKIKPVKTDEKATQTEMSDSYIEYPRFLSKPSRSLFNVAEGSLFLEDENESLMKPLSSSLLNNQTVEIDSKSTPGYDKIKSKWNKLIEETREESLLQESTDLASIEEESTREIMKPRMQISQSNEDDITIEVVQNISTKKYLPSYVYFYSLLVLLILLLSVLFSTNVWPSYDQKSQRNYLIFNQRTLSDKHVPF